MNTKLSHHIAELTQSLKLYYQAKIDLGKLLLLKKASKALNVIFGLLVIILLSVIIMAFAGGAFIIWYGTNYNDYLEGTIIVIGFLIMLLLGFLLFKTRILTSVFLSTFSTILFDEDEDDD